MWIISSSSLSFESDPPHFICAFCLEMKGWDLVAAAEKEADAVAEELADSIYFSNPENRK